MWRQGVGRGKGRRWGTGGGRGRGGGTGSWRGGGGRMGSHQLLEKHEKPIGVFCMQTLHSLAGYLQLGLTNTVNIRGWGGGGVHGGLHISPTELVQ